MKKLYIETYGCQMNVYDSDIVASIMIKEGYSIIRDINQADIIFVNTCAIRENAVERVKKQISGYNQYKKVKKNLIIGVLGCVAQHSKEEILDKLKIVDLIAGPDGYKDLPKLVEIAQIGEQKSNLNLSETETYSDITPFRIKDNGVSAFVAIMRGCNNFCTYCVVPYTRGRERSSDPKTIINQISDLHKKGYREVTLLGQNVNSYFWEKENLNFAKLLEKVALISPNMRIRFLTSHPKDISEELVLTIKKYKNICNFLHLPFQSGSDRILKKMNRKYTAETYLEKIKMIKKHIPEIGLSTDIISGFCDETQKDHLKTIELMKKVQYDHAFMFAYSERMNTIAQKKYDDNVSEKIKKQRLSEIIKLQKEHSEARNNNDIGKKFEVLIDGFSKKSNKMMRGRNQQNKLIVFEHTKKMKIGDYVNIKIINSTSATLIGKVE